MYDPIPIFGNSIIGKLQTKIANNRKLNAKMPVGLARNKIVDLLSWLCWFQIQIRPSFPIKLCKFIIKLYPNLVLQNPKTISSFLLYFGEQLTATISLKYATAVINLLYFILLLVFFSPFFFVVKRTSLKCNRLNQIHN